MSRQVVVVFRDDYEETHGHSQVQAADQVVTFGLHGQAYEIDLADSNVKLLEEALADFIAAARPVSELHTSWPANSATPRSFRHEPGKARSKQDRQASKELRTSLRKYLESLGRGDELPVAGVISSRLRSEYDAYLLSQAS